MKCERQERKAAIAAAKLERMKQEEEGHRCRVAYLAGQQMLRKTPPQRCQKYYDLAVCGQMEMGQDA